MLLLLVQPQVIDGRAGEAFVALERSAEGGAALRQRYDACASWWTQARAFPSRLAAPLLGSEVSFGRPVHHLDSNCAAWLLLGLRKAPSCSLSRLHVWMHDSRDCMTVAHCMTAGGWCVPGRRASMQSCSRHVCARWRQPLASGCRLQ